MGISAEELCSSHSERQLEILRWHFMLRMNNLSRSDHYLMQIAHEVARGHVKSPNALHHEQFKIKFILPKPEPVLTPEEREAKRLEDAARAKAVYFARVGYTGKKKS